MSVFVIAIACLGLTSPDSVRGICHGSWHIEPFSSPQFVNRWGHGDTNSAHNEIAVDKEVIRNGKPTIRLITNAGFDNWVYFPNTKDWDLDLSVVKSLKFYLKSVNKHGWGGDPWIIFLDMSGRSARFDGTKRRLYDALTDWSLVEVPVGNRCLENSPSLGWKPTIETRFDWKHVSCVQIHQDTDDFGYTIWYSGFEFTGAKPIKWWLSSVNKPDLSVTYAEQRPLYRRYFPNYDKKYPVLLGKEVNEKHWPDAGEKVTYRVHVKNMGFAESKPTDFICKIDGKVVKKSRIPALVLRQDYIVEVPWKWKQGPIDFIASVDSDGNMDEISEKNNLLWFKTNAYTLAAICEKAIISPLNRTNNWYGSFSFEDWMRGATVDKLNMLARKSRYDFAPKGAEINVRLEKLIIVDKILNDGGKQDKEFGLDYIDGTWHYPINALDEWIDLANSFDWALNHELTHQLGIIDNYQYDLGADRNKVNGKGFGQPNGGMMGGGHINKHTYPAYADVDVAGLNFTKGLRRGYYGEYMFCIPEKNTLVVSIGGKPLANAEIRIYQKDMDTGNIDGPPVFEGKTDANGHYPLANRPVPYEYTTATGCSLRPNPFGYPDVVGRNGLFLIRTQIEGKFFYGFIDIGHFVVEYARGQKDANYPLELIAE